MNDNDIFDVLDSSNKSQENQKYRSFDVFSVLTPLSADVDVQPSSTKDNTEFLSQRTLRIEFD